MDHKTKTPLQNWAWNRFMLKGFVTGNISRLNTLLSEKDLDALEQFDLIAIHHIFTSILRRWDMAQTRTRKLREEEVKPNA